MPFDGWVNLGNPPGVNVELLAIGRNADGRLEIFASGDDDCLWHIWEAGGGWSDWAAFGAPKDKAIKGPISVGLQQNSRVLKVVALDAGWLSARRCSDSSQ